MKAYLLPENPAPDHLRCVRIYLPDDPGFVAAFWGSMDYLATWLAWERDDDHTAAIAAASMQAAVDLSRDEWLVKGCATIIEAPYTEETPDGRTPAEAATDDLFAWLIDLLTAILDALADSVPTAEIKADIAGEIASVTGKDGTDTADKMVEAMAGKTPAEQAAAVDPDNWQDLRNRSYCKQPEYLTDKWSYSHWLDRLAESLIDAITEDLDDAIDWLFDALNAAAALITGENASQIIEAGDGGGASFGWTTPDCIGCRRYYFRDDLFGWDVTTGTWVADEGIRTEQTAGREKIDVFLDLPDEPNITEVAIEYDSTQQATSPHYVRIWGTPPGESESLLYSGTIEGGIDRHVILPLDQQLDQVHVGITYFYTGQTAWLIWVQLTSDSGVVPSGRPCDYSEY